MYDDEYLQHHGVKGMKWGIRRTRNTSNAISRSTTSDIHEDYKNAHSKTSVKSMSDAELRKRINRLQMEQQYSNLSPKNINKGKKFMNKIMKAGTTVATVTGTALTIYNNFDRINKIVRK